MIKIVEFEKKHGVPSKFAKSLAYATLISTAIIWILLVIFSWSTLVDYAFTLKEEELEDTLIIQKDEESFITSREASLKTNLS